MTDVTQIIADKENLINGIKALGISAAAVFPVGDITFDPIFRDMCKQNLCGNYSRNYMCPPSVGEFDDLKNEVLSYKNVILIQTIYSLEDSYDFEGMEEGGKVHGENMNKTLDYIKEHISFENIKVLGVGGCKLCPKCGIIENRPCPFPDKANSSVEGYCMNVAQMTNSHGLKYINGENTVSYVAVFLLK
ncbi:MAG: DUF2284 domain-containing protein [Oscillospiraceae bacterium]|nr:DUF2284 domain-containing protein [Oscillospiraceae bacterium]